MEGIDRMLQQRRARLDAGEQPLGWKSGFGSASAQAQLRIDAPLIGFLTSGTVVAPGAEVSVDGWAQPVIEPELAIYLDAEGGIAEIGLAYELVDFDPPPDDAVSILGRNIYHRGVVLGPERTTSLDGLRALILKNGAEIARADDVQEFNGPVSETLRHVRAVAGDELRAGDVVIAGSIVPPIPVAPGDRFRYELEPVGVLELSFAPSASSVSS